MRAPPEAANRMNGRAVPRRRLEPGDDGGADRHAERAGHEIEILHRDGDRVAESLPVATSHRVVHAGLGAALLEAVGVALLVAEFQRIVRHRGQRHGVVLAAVEEVGQPVGGLDLHVVAGIRHHPLVGLEIAVEHHLARLGALHPEVLRRRLLLVEEGADFRTDDVVDPVHLLACRWRDFRGQDARDEAVKPYIAIVAVVVSGRPERLPACYWLSGARPPCAARQRCDQPGERRHRARGGLAVLEAVADRLAERGADHDAIGIAADAAPRPRPS